MNDVLTLAYLDLLRVKNYLHSSSRNAGRVLLWIGALVYLALMGSLRTLTAGSAPPVRGVPEPFASALVLSALALFFVQFLAGKNASRIAFASVADARFLASSKFNPKIVGMWLQVRGSAGFLARMAFLIILYVFIFPKAGTARGLILTMALGAALLGTTPIPSILAERRLGKKAMSAIFGAIATVLGLCALAVVSSRFTDFILAVECAQIVQHLHLGAFLNGALTGSNHAAYLLMAGLVVALIAIGYVCGGDLYPELYAATIKSPGERKRLGAERSRRSPSRATRGSVFFGTWTVIWKEWITMWRAPNALLTFLFALVCSLLVAAGVTRLAALSGAGPDLYAALYGGGGNLVVILSATSAIALSGDFRKPIWWNFSGSLRTRFYAWTFATSLRFIAVAVVFALSICLFSHQPSRLSTAVTIAILFPLLLRATGLATYAILPAPADQRGPIAILRMLLAYFLIIPCAIAYWLGAIIPAAALAVIQIVLLIEFAVFRIRENGARFALLERT